MRLYGKVFVLLLGGLCLSAGTLGSDLSFRVYGGVGYVDGGDLSRSISGWRSYYRDRQGPTFSSTYELGEMRGTAELGAEAVLALSRHWSLSLGVGYIHQGTKGKITTLTTRHEDIPVSSSEVWTLDFEETSGQNPVYRKASIPILLSLDYSLALSAKWTLTLGGGGGIYLGNVDFQDSYDIQSESISEQQTGSGVVQYVDRLTTAGDYSENTRSTGYGLHGRIGLELELNSSTFLTVSVLGRWANMKSWKGTSHDASEWQWTYGLWGANSAEGTDERSEDGQYWTYEMSDEKSGRSYPILAFRDTGPLPSSRSANFSLSGISVRVGLGFRFGGKS